MHNIWIYFYVFINLLICQFLISVGYFFPGVRALLVDKDQNPKWKPNTLEGVTNATVDKYFSELPSDRELAL